ncbi:MAG: hypothetical protein K2P58_02860 [Hyphomonadaceae bacterium]|nr:hypothetical protein [Hyphomonadaceae bacterium]
MHDIRTRTIQRLAAPIVTQECWTALDHLRNALDSVEPDSPEAERLLRMIRELTSFADATLSRR